MKKQPDQYAKKRERKEKANDAKLKRALNEQNNLEQYYKGDKAWEAYLENYKEQWNKCEFKSELINSLNGNNDIAIAIYGKFENGALSYINEKVPILDNITPKECLENSSLLNRLKEAIMRTPCL